MKYCSEDKKKREKEEEDRREVLNFSFILRDGNSSKAMKFNSCVYLQQLVIPLFRAIYVNLLCIRFKFAVERRSMQ